MSIKKIMHKDRHGAQVSIEFGEGGAASNLVEQFLGGLGVPAMQDIPREHPGDPKGTDTVPAWLTPGEFVMNAEATRMFEPQIEEMNNAGRAVQRQQGGSIPEYKSYGGSIPEYYNAGGMSGYSHEDMLDALMMVESGGNFNAVSPAGAQGPYQIMPNTAAKPGYGVTPIAPEDVFDPQKSRVFASQYLKGLARQYPDATQQEIFQMYNAGAARVKNANAFNPLAQETINYPGKIQAELERQAKLRAAKGDTDDYDIPLDYNTVPVPEEVTMESLRSPTSDEDVLTSLKDREKPPRVSTKERQQRAVAELLKNSNNPFAIAGRGVGAVVDGISSGLDYLGDRSDIVGARSTEGLLAKNAAEREELLAGLKTGDLDPNYVKERLETLEKLDNRAIGKSERAATLKAQGAEEDRLEAVDDINQKADKLEAAGYKEEAEALRKTAPPPLTSDGVTPLTPSQVASGMVAPVEDRSMTTAQINAEVDSAQDQDDKAAAVQAASAQLKKDISGGAYTSDSVKKYNTTGDPNDLVDKGDKTMLSRVTDFFKEGLGTVLDKGALSEAATLYLGSRALGYDHDGSLNFVTKRYSKGIEDKLATAKKAVGTYTNESITKYKDTGNLMDLTLIPKLIDQGKPAYFINPKDGTTFDLRTAKDEKGVTRYIDVNDKVVDTRRLLTAAQYNARSDKDKDRVRKLIDSRKKSMTAKAKSKGDDDYDVDSFINTEEVAEAMAQFTMQSGANTANTAKLTGYVIDNIIAHRSNPDMKAISDRDLTEMMLVKAVVRSMEEDIYAAEKGNDPIPTAVSSQIIQEAIPNINKLGGPVGSGQLLKVIYQFGYKPLTSDQKKKYIMDAGKTHNGFLEYLKKGHGFRDKNLWQPMWQALNQTAPNQ